jgi:predicted adenylyl cyclase CyaB
MKEIEAKILEVDSVKIAKTLIVLGAKKVFDGEVETFFLDFKDGSIIKARDLLRLRREEDKTELTFKKVHQTESAKIAEEYTVEVSDLETAKKILQFLGLNVTESMLKHRTSYTLENARFDFDRYNGDYGFVPEFLEIEADSVEAVHKYAKLLGFNAKNCLPWSTKDLIEHYASNLQKHTKKIP